MKQRSIKYTGFVFGEGRKDKKFLIALISQKKFIYHTKNWEFNYGNGKGCSALDVLKECEKTIGGKLYDLVMCFIDLDDLKHDFPNSWKNVQSKLENQYSDFSIIWQINNLEDEYKVVLGDVFKSKQKINAEAIKQINKFINSKYWKKIIKCIKDRENELIGI